MRVFALSDIHIDFQENADWLKRLSRWDYTEDTLILAGDISDSVDRLKWCFEQCKSIFNTTFFVPGNHDIWVKSSDNLDSLEKFDALLELAREYDILVEPARVDDVMIAPVFSWYDFSFGQPTDYIRKAWMDFKRCRWPDHLPDETALCQYFLGRNIAPQGSYKTLISYSHFLPRIDVMPSVIPPKKREIYSVLGATCVDDYIRSLGSNIHVYGHSHVNVDVTIQNIRYINNAFGYPNETRIARKNLFNII